MGIFHRWGRWMVRYRWWVVLGWIAGCLLVTVLGLTMQSQLVRFARLPGAESANVVNAVRWSFNDGPGDSAFIIVQADDGVTDPAVRTRLEPVFAAPGLLPETVGVVTPFDNPGQISADGTIAYAVVQFDEFAAEMEQSSLDQLRALSTGGSADDGLVVEVSGPVIGSQQTERPDDAAVFGFVVTLLMLIASFGTVVAMGIPAVTSLVALATGFFAVAIVTPLIDVSTLIPAFALMVGIGVSFDYALFIVQRYREHLEAGMPVSEAVEHAVDTAGRAVLFAGVLVTIPLLGLFIIGVPFVAGLGVAGAVIVGFSVLASLSLLPALLAFAGTRIDRWKLPFLYKRADTGRTAIAYKVAVRMLGRPILFLSITVVILILLLIPFFGVDLGFSRTSNNPISFHTERGHQLLNAGFGQGFIGPLIVTAQNDTPIPEAALARLRTVIAGTEGVDAVSAPVANQQRTIGVVTAVPAAGPDHEQAGATVERIRQDAIPGATGGDDLGDVVVSGPAAKVNDITTRINARSLLYFLAVIGASAVLLLVLLRSIVLAVKAVLISAISVGSAMGLVVVVAQWGWLPSLIQPIQPGPIEPYLPLMLFALLFGLAINYELFLLSRVRDAYVQTRDNDEALEEGIAGSARFMTAAAAIMVRVFLAFLLLGNSRAAGQLGLGLGLAVVLDVALVRAVLVPASMKLLDRWNWWLPSWLERRLPDLHIEGDVRG